MTKEEAMYCAVLYHSKRGDLAYCCDHLFEMTEQIRRTGATYKEFLDTMGNLLEENISEEVLEDNPVPVMKEPEWLTDETDTLRELPPELCT